MNYQIKKPEELTEYEIETMLALWEVEAWSTLTPEEFRISFKDSEFHLLFETNGEIASLLRLNFGFVLKISGQQYSFTELGGLAAAQKGKGSGTLLMKLSIENIRKRNLETIGFCFSDLRPFYEKCGVEILFDKAKNIKEKEDNEWIISEDDDILVIHLSKEKENLMHQIGSENYAYLI
ncbi:putative GNAT superfamily acetyltransferase [Chryseobacterium sp. H1D6B]|uniref:GNAT family N-acetyltransferase n=1 Tax=Chryseobacterium sp. H1D6B TaxID=2940588 RepID=UPI0015C9D319|nr:GNAT family N-acetyltransferase [Chryseobacterium sp. H1D6B]MDH6253174.1 putative GNAT superfamily acetyltransferase [Chryseobacterium sp. H1D6B]